MQVRGANVLLTGASGGIGGAIARALAAGGASLTLTGRRADVLDALGAELGARSLVVDLNAPEQVESLAEQARGADILIANAGLPASGTLDSFSIEELDRALDVNLRAPIVLARGLLPGMLERRRGHLVFISSIAGKASAAGSSVYSATKYGLRGFAAGLRSDLHGSGVGVSTVFPGFISDSGMFADAAVELPRAVGGTRTPEDVAEAVIDAIEHDRAEVDVAPLPLRAGAVFAALAPGAAATVARRLGADEVGRELAANQAEKR
jgi:short-subunit dehydrogenase